MSLKHVHVAFIALCVGLLLFCAFWALQSSPVGAGWPGIAVAAASVSAAGALIQYERGFLERCRKAGVS